MNRGVNHVPGFACKPSTWDVQMVRTFLWISLFIALSLVMGTLEIPLCRKVAC